MAGKYSAPSSSVCVDCDAGTYSKSSSMDCSFCPIGTVTNDNMSGCKVCPPGSVFKDFVACVECQPGYYQSGANCLQCAAGSSTKTPGSTKCTTVEVEIVRRDQFSTMLPAAQYVRQDIINRGGAVYLVLLALFLLLLELLVAAFARRDQ